MSRPLAAARYLKIPLWDPFVGARDSGIRVANANGMPMKAPPPPTLWNWSGAYGGAHVGGALSATDFSDPFGASVYGDTVRSPAFLGGGQIGYNRQAPGSHWVLGAEADGSLLSTDGDNTCFAAASGRLLLVR
jgi:hypothetical protein